MTIRNRRFAEREKQIRLAHQRGEAHIGVETTETAEMNRERKRQRREQDRLAMRNKQG